MHFNFRGPHNELLTEVWVNPITKKVRFKNHTNDPFDCVFGMQKTATYQDLIDFFESRTFPRNRANIDDILEEFGLKKYDPYLLCKKLGQSPRPFHRNGRGLLKEIQLFLFLRDRVFHSSNRPD